MRPAISTLILACIAAFGSEFAAAQAVNDRQAAEATGPRTESSAASATAPAEPADAAVEKDRSNVGPVRWMAPETLDKRVASAAPGASDGPDENQTRKSDEDGRTDKSEAARARRINSEPCPLPQPGGSDPASTASGASSTASSGGAVQGCGTP